MQLLRVLRRNRRACNCRSLDIYIATATHSVGKKRAPLTRPRPQPAVARTNDDDPRDSRVVDVRVTGAVLGHVVERVGTNREVDNVTDGVLIDDVAGTPQVSGPSTGCHDEGMEVAPGVAPVEVIPRC